jgi:hypothetical protein
LNRHSKFFYHNDINKEYPFFISKLLFSVQIVVRFAVPAKKSGTVGTVPTVPGATAVPPNLSNCLPTTIGEIVTYNLCNNDDYRTQGCRLQTSSKSFFPFTKKLWNSLLDSVNSLPTFSKLKKNHSTCPNSGGFILQYRRQEN